MLLKIIRYIKGYIRIRITGYSTERFLNACSHKGILLWGLQPVPSAYEMNISIQGFRQLKPIIRKTGTKVTIVRRSGLPFFLHKYRRRKLFFAGAVLCVALVFLMSRYIWNIDITGNQTRTDETLLEFLKTQEVKNGMLKSQVDCSRIVKDIRKEYDDIIWVSASIQGTRLIIRIKENEDSIPATDKKAQEAAEGEDSVPKEQASDIVADQDCVITKIVPRRGIPMVQEGVEVKKGDILISGQVPVVDDAGETIGYQYQESDADILGQTAISYQEELKNTYRVKEYLTVHKDEYFLQLGQYRIRFASIKNQYESWEMHGEFHQLRLGEGLYFPIYYGKRTASPYKASTEKYTKSEIQKILTQSFQRYCKDLEKKGVEIIQNDVKIYTGSEKAEAKGNLVVLMPIGTQAPSQLLEIPVKEEQEETGE